MTTRRSDSDSLRERWIDLYYDLIALIMANLLWFLLTLPVVTALPALGALFYVTNRLAHGNGADWRTFVEGFRALFWLSWRWGLVALLILGILGGNVWFYARTDAGWAFWALMGALSLLGFSGVLLLFMFPLLLEQADRRLSVAARNSLVMLIRRPLYSLGVGASIMIVFLLSVYIMPPLWIFLSASLITYFANRAVVESIAVIAGEQHP